MAKKEFVLRERIEFYDAEFFGDKCIHEYNVRCFDGVAFGRLCDKSDTNAPIVIVVTYPKLDEVSKDNNMANYVLTYNGLFDLTPNDIDFGDILMAYGEICPRPTKDGVKSE